MAAQQPHEPDKPLISMIRTSGLVLGSQQWQEMHWHAAWGEVAIVTFPFGCRMKKGPSPEAIPATGPCGYLS